MNIAILIGHFPPGVVGGAELQAEAWAGRLSKAHAVTVITRRDPPWQPAFESRDGYRVVRLPVSRWPIVRTLADVAGIERAVRDLSPRPDVLLCFMTFVSGLAGVRVGRALGIPSIVWIRGDAEYRLQRSRVHRVVSPWVWKHADAVLVQSERNRVDLLRELARVEPALAAELDGRLTVVPNGLELPAEPLPPGRRVLAVGRLIDDKGMDLVITACARAGLPLTLAGDGPERPKLEALARELRADVRFEGFVGRDGLDALFRDASACVLASRRGEGLPNATLEAMSYARPVVVTPSGATRDLVEDGRNGLIVNVEDVAGLQAALVRLHADPAEAARMGAQARESARAYAWESVTPRLGAVLERWAPRGERASGTSASGRPGVRRRRRVCFYVPYMYPLFSGGRIDFTGGSEVHMSLLARGMARLGFDVDVVTCDYGQPAEVHVDGLRLLRAWPPEGGLPVARFFHPRLTRTIAALRASRADVYVVQGAGLNAGLTCDVAHARGARFVFLAGSDFDVTGGLPRVYGPRDRWWAHRALRGADAIVTQTGKQNAILRSGFGREGVVIMNPVDVPERVVDVASNRAVVWLATYKDIKRPEWFTRFAERHPDVRCIMAGVIPIPPLDDRDYRAALEVAARRPNLEVRGPIPHERIGDLLAEGAVFAHTSPAEGFPNTFLEAWSHGLPTLTTFDPDDLITRERLGEKHDTFEAWEDALLRWLADPELRRETGARARAYAERAHGERVVLEGFARLLDEVGR